MNLRRWLGTGVVLIGSAAAQVSGDLPAVEPDSTSLDAVFSRLSNAPFALDLRAARGDPAAWAWLGRVRSLHSGITTHIEIVPRKGFDALVYLKSLSPAHPL